MGLVKLVLLTLFVSYLLILSYAEETVQLNLVNYEPPRVSRRPNFLREYPNEKYLFT